MSAVMTVLMFNRLRIVWDNTWTAYGTASKNLAGYCKRYGMEQSPLEKNWLEWTWKKAHTECWYWKMLHTKRLQSLM